VILHNMKTAIRVSSRQDEHMIDEYLWPESQPLILPAVGDEFATNRFGLRTVVRRHFAYKSGEPSSNVTDLIVDIVCE
jgi:hypothetical protein